MKRILKITLCTFMIVGIVACGGKEDNSSVAEDNNVQTTDVQENSYESTLLKIHKASQDYKGKISDIIMYDHTLYVLAENKVYNASLNTYAEVIEVDENAKEIMNIYDYAALMKNNDGSYSYVTSNGSYQFKEDHLFYSMIGSELTNIVFDQGQLYVHSYDYKNDLSKPQSSKKILIKQGEGSSAQYIDTIKDMYCFGARNFFVLLNDDVLYDTYGDGTFSSSLSMSKYKDDASFIIRNFPKLEKVQKVYATSIRFGRPLYSVVGDSSSLYTYDKSVRNEIGIPSADKQIQIAMPDNYTVDNIKTVVFNKGLLVAFDDGNVYIASKNDISHLEMNEELSNLNKENKIIEFGSDVDFVVLMNDKTLYEFK